MMADVNLKAVMGVNEARRTEVTARMYVQVTVTRRYMWWMKLKTIWAVIRAKREVQE